MKKILILLLLVIISLTACNRYSVYRVKTYAVDTYYEPLDGCDGSNMAFQTVEKSAMVKCLEKGYDGIMGLSCY